MRRLEGKVAIITGASSGIGHATAKLFAAEGARLVVGARRGLELEKLVGAIEAAGGKAVALAGYVQSEDYAQALVEAAVRHFGKLDVAFNNAGTVGEAGPTTHISLNGWNEALAVNLTSGLLAAKYQIPEMIKAGGGSIIFTSSFVGYSCAFPGWAAYATCKAGQIGLTQSLAVEYAPHGIRVNAVLPGSTGTPMFRAMSPQMQEQFAGWHALKRVGTPEEIAKHVLYLASDDASFVTGAAHLVDGGISIART